MASPDVQQILPPPETSASQWRRTHPAEFASEEAQARIAQELAIVRWLNGERVPLTELAPTCFTTYACMAEQDRFWEHQRTRIG